LVAIHKKPSNWFCTTFLDFAGWTIRIVQSAESRNVGLWKKNFVWADTLRFFVFRGVFHWFFLTKEGFTAIWRHGLSLMFFEWEGKGLSCDVYLSRFVFVTREETSVRAPSILSHISRPFTWWTSRCRPCCFFGRYCHCGFSFCSEEGKHMVSRFVCFGNITPGKTVSSCSNLNYKKIYKNLRRQF